MQKHSTILLAGKTFVDSFYLFYSLCLRSSKVLFTTNDIYAKNGNGWSDPIFFDFPGYDTSLFWDDDGKVYVQGSHAWRVFPAIQQYEIDLKTGASLSGDLVTLWEGTGGLVRMLVLCILSFIRCNLDSHRLQKALIFIRKTASITS